MKSELCGIFGLNPVMWWKLTWITFKLQNSRIIMAGPYATKTLLGFSAGHNLDKFSVVYLIKFPNIGVNWHNEVRFSDP